MEYSDEYLRQQLPNEDPPSEFVPGDVNREIASGLSVSTARTEICWREVFRWTYAIFSELGLGNFRSQGFLRPPWADPSFYWSWSGTWHSEMIVGLWDEKTEAPGFGLSVNIPRHRGFPPFYVVDILEFPRLVRNSGSRSGRWKQNCTRRSTRQTPRAHAGLGATPSNVGHHYSGARCRRQLSWPFYPT
jgi:hypothetical protein